MAMVTRIDDSVEDAHAPITIAVTNITPLESADPTGDEPPYMIVVVADLTESPQPRVRATRYGLWGDRETGARAGVRPIPPGLTPAAIDALANFAVLRRPFWGLDNRTARPIARPEDLIILVAPVRDDGDGTGLTRELAQATVVADLAESGDLERADRIPQLIAALNARLDLPAGLPTDIEPRGARELALTRADLQRTHLGPHTRALVVTDAHGRYRIDFEFLRG